MSVPPSLAIAGWVIYFVMAPTLGFGILDSWHNEQRILQLVLMLLGAALLCMCLVLWPTAIETLPPLAFAIILIGLISALQSNFEEYAFAEVALAVELAALALCVATLVRRRPGFAARAFLGCAWLIGLIYIVAVGANYMATWSLSKPVDSEVFILGYSNPRFASTMHALILPLLASLMLHPRKAVAFSSLPIAAMLWAINIALGTRAIWAAFAISLLVYWVIDRNGARLIKAIVISAAIGILIFGIVFVIAPNLLPQEGSMQARLGGLADDRGRYQLWVAALNQVVAHPWLGSGPMQFATLRQLNGAHPHNWALQIAAEWGLPVLVLVCIGIVHWALRLKATLSLADHRNIDNALPPLALSVLTALVYGMVDGIWVMPVSQSLATVFLGATIGLTSNYGERGAVPVYRSALTAGIVLSSTLFLGYFVVKTLPDQKRSEMEYVRESGIQYYYPRFWQQGLLLDLSKHSNRNK